MDLNVDKQKATSVRNSVSSDINKLIKKWCYIKNDYFYGPFTDDELTEVFLSNQIELTDYILNKVSEDWHEASELEFLKPEYIQLQKEKKLNEDQIVFEKNVQHKIAGADKKDYSLLQKKMSDDDIMSSIHHLQTLDFIDTSEINRTSEIQSKATRQNSAQLKKHWNIQIAEILQLLQQQKIVSILFAVLAALTIYLVRNKSIQNQMNQQLSLLNQNQIRTAQSVSEKSYDSFGFIGKFFILDQADQIYLQLVSNVKSNIELNIKVEGLSSSLVGAFNYSKIFRVHSRYGFFEPIKLDKTIPKGEYRLSVTCYDCESIDIGSGKELMLESIFLNGVKNKAYDRELAKYHATVRAKAKDELIYFNQVLDLFKDQMDTLTLRFGNNIKQKIQVSKYWDKYYNAWPPLSTQFDLEMDRLKSESSNGEIFYDDVVADLQNLNHLAKEYIQTMDTEIRRFFLSQKIEASDMQKIEKSKELAFKKISTLREKIEIYEKLPLSVNGMPQKN